MFTYRNESISLLSTDNKCSYFITGFLTAAWNIPIIYIFKWNNCAKEYVSMHTVE